VRIVDFPLSIFACRFAPPAIENRKSKIENQTDLLRQPSKNGVIATTMPTAINKQRVLSTLFTSLKKKFDPPEPQPRPVLEQFLYALCREGTTRDNADRSYKFLQERFFDWNEVRVSSVHEVEEAFEGLPEAELRAHRMISLLQEVFETTFSFDLEPLQKKGLKQAAKQLARYQAANDYAVAWVVQQSLGGHAIPLDPPSLRVLRRLGLIDNDQEDLEALRASLEHQIPKNRGPLFNELVSIVADEFCWEDDPNCAACPLRHECPTGQESRAAATAASAERTTRKPR
jgi:endonuclease-3